MGGLNSLGGLNNVNVDFRPTVELNAPEKDGTALQQPVVPVVPENAPQPPKAEAKSVVRQLDVLLMNAAGKSVGADIANNVKTVGGSLVEKGVLTQTEVDSLNELAKDAAQKLRALDKFSGKEFAQAMTWQTEQIDADGDNSGTGQESIGVLDYDGESEVGQAVQAAIDAQLALSEKLGEFNDRLAQSDKIDDVLQDQFTELQFQCDRRATEIDSVVARMYDLAQKNVAEGRVADPKIQALLDAKFMELLPREAIMMHGTAEAFEAISRTLGDKLRPLAEKLDAFKADGSKILTKDEIASLQTAVRQMSNAVANVRKNGIDVRTLKSGEIHDGVDNRTDMLGDDRKKITVRTEVDKSLLDEMEKILVDVEGQIGDVKKTSVDRTVDAFIKEVRASLYPEEAPGAAKVNVDSSDLVGFTEARKDLMAALDGFAKGEITQEQFNATVNGCIKKIYADNDLKVHLQGAGFDENAVKDLFKAMRGLCIVREQFKELLNSAKRQKDAPDLGLAQSDVRRIMLGETGLSNVVEAKVHGFRPGDVDPAAEAQNIVGSRPFGSGNAGKTYLLTTKTGAELVFKPELDSRTGLDMLTIGKGNAYKTAQKTVNLNLATQDTAKAFGCEDLVVKYSVGSHDGQFGVFMEKAKGFTGEDFHRKKKTEGDGFAPAGLKDIITDEKTQAKIQGQLAQKLNKLMWLDLITGQGDRHWNNYFVHIDKKTYEVTVKAIDNDASFTARQVGLQKYALDKTLTDRFFKELEEECDKLHGDGDKDDDKKEYSRRVSVDPAIMRHDDGTVTVDLAQAKSLEVKMALNQILGVQSIAIPEEIDKEFYDKLMEMDADPDKKKTFLDTIKPRISDAALKATEMRLNEAIEYAKKLDNSKVFGNDDWKVKERLSKIPWIKSKVGIVNSDGKTVEVDRKMGEDENKKGNFVGKYLTNSCPSYYKRDYLHKMFN